MPGALSPNANSTIARAPVAPQRSTFVQNVAKASTIAPAAPASTSSAPPYNQPDQNQNPLDLYNPGISGPARPPGFPNAGDAPPPPPSQPTGPDHSAYDLASKNYLDSLQESDPVKAARQRYLNFIKSRDLGLQNIEDQAIAMPFITGQQASLNRRAQIDAARLQGDYEIASNDQASQREYAKTAYGIEADRLKFLEQLADKEKDRQFDLNKPIAVGAETSLVSRGKDGNYTAAYTAPDATTDKLLSVNDALALGVPYGTKQSEALGKTPQRAPTAQEQITSGYALRIQQANPIIESNQNAIISMNPVSFEAQLRLPSYAQSATIQNYMQSSRNFINSVLRRESGAVISPTEFAEARQQYLPQPGDNPTVLAQKKANRDLVSQTFVQQSGSALNSGSTSPTSGGSASYPSWEQIILP
jgi:hypothetical protein